MNGEERCRKELVEIGVKQHNYVRFTVGASAEANTEITTCK